MSTPSPSPSPVADLTARLARYPADRYPVQHATASFHLGAALTDAGRYVEAERALAVAAELFDRDRMPAEHAKALNARGAALRAARLPEAAAECFRRAEETFAAQGMPRERGAAAFNLGLALRELGEDALECFGRARELLADVPVYVAAVHRETGVALLTAGRSAEAVSMLAEAVAIADRVGDVAGLGSAANSLGLAQLAEGRPSEAIGTLKRAAAAHPRAVRPEGYAMAKANLALAYERAGDLPRARLSARQALGVPGVVDAVCATAAGVITRIGDGGGALLAVLDIEPVDRWPDHVREELVRWADAWPEDRAEEAAAFVTGVLERRAAGAEIVATWLAGLLELPPAPMRTLAGDVVAALLEGDPDAVERFRSLVARGCARFHIPQMERLTALFEDLAAPAGGPASWR